MSTASELKRYREQAVSLRKDISGHSKTVADKRKKAADAQSAASRSRSDATIRSKLREAETATNAANTAERKRADAEKKLADVEKKVADLQTQFAKRRPRQALNSGHSLARKLRSYGNQGSARNSQIFSFHTPAKTRTRLLDHCVRLWKTAGSPSGSMNSRSKLATASARRSRRASRALGSVSSSSHRASLRNSGRRPNSTPFLRRRLIVGAA